MKMEKVIQIQKKNKVIEMTVNISTVEDKRSWEKQNQHRIIGWEWENDIMEGYSVTSFNTVDRERKSFAIPK